MNFGKLLWKVPPFYKQCRKSIFRIDLKNKNGCLVILNHGWGEREREMHTDMEVPLLSFRETKREITVIKIDEEKEQVRGWLIIVVSRATYPQQGGGMREIPLSHGMVLYRGDVSASVIHGKFGSLQPMTD